MERDDVRLSQQWAAGWQDLIEFEFVPIAPSMDTTEALMPQLDQPSDEPGTSFCPPRE